MLFSPVVVATFVLFLLVVGLGSYVLLLRTARSVDATRAYQVFRVGYPVGVVLLAVGSGVALYAVNRLFTRIHLFGVAVDAGLVLDLGIGTLVTAFAGELALLGWITAVTARDSNDGWRR